MSYRGTRHESTQLPRQAIEDACRIDYAFGFTISQGSGTMQRVHYSLLRPHYARTWEQSALTSVADQYETDHKAMIPKMPAGHAKYLSLTLRAPVPQEFAIQWADFSDCTLRGKGEIDDTRIGWTHFLVAKSMIGHDIRKVTEGRASENAFTDAHASFFRNYVLLGEPTNSFAFDASLAELRSYVQTSELMASDEVATLKSVWAERHPGEQFIPKV